MRLHSPDYALSALFGSQLQETIDSFVLNELSTALLSERYLLSKSVRKLASYPESGIPGDLPVWLDLLSILQESNPLFGQCFIIAIFDKLKDEVSAGHVVVLLNWALWSQENLVRDRGDVTGLVTSMLGRGTYTTAEKKV